MGGGWRVSYTTGASGASCFRGNGIRKLSIEIKQTIVDLRVTFPLLRSVFGRCQSVESIEAQYFVTFAGFTIAIAIVSCMGSACGTVVYLTRCSCQ